MGSRYECNSPKENYSRFTQVLVMTTLPCVMLINMSDETCAPLPKRQKYNSRCRTYKSSTGILTCFPFLLVQLGLQLGSTNPWLIFIVKEPLPFRWYWFSQYYVPTIARIFISARSRSPLGKRSTRAERLPIHHPKMCYCIGNWFSPVHFRNR